MAGDHDLLHRLDEACRRELELLTGLDELSIGVGPRDVHQHKANLIVKLARELRSAIYQCDAFEANELVPFIEVQLDRDRREQLGQQARKASRRGPTHPHPSRPPADERSTLAMEITGRFDRLHDVAEHPEKAVETGGEEGP